MSTENKKELKKSHKSGDDSDSKSTTAQPDIEDYQDPGRAEHHVTTPGSGADITHDLLQVGASFPDEEVNIDLISKTK
ncbi:uncharacterized protein BHQ10_010188 [Talaromyces amestolkiae]|uniref:Uncharacterized protein n=1 Tax=Talaromyces amestolkiae TaxID=1196081 RepID=A0A364LED4_TALAM|nr:uncharacterized protein BHQ10_010188 [Talaromyces amestolkiae]RAO74176.1 hypothetical protein BHQ10_010188 [Talaromyces amestolkiae]